jgi:GT2 family glycosyltransferase
MTENPLSFDVVIATKNRQAILPFSLRTILSQSLLPRRLIVVDSSNDHPEVQKIVVKAVRGLAPSVNTKIIQSDPGLPHQRNVGIAEVVSAVVFFPDDDVLWFPGAAEAIMRIYSRDAEGMVGCVAASDSVTPPPGVFELVPPPYKIAFRDRLTVRRSVLGRLVFGLVPDPLHPGRTWMSTWGAKTPPTWLHEEDAELCAAVTGYKMTFRTRVIREIGGFDERMGGYALYEDADASIGCLNLKLNIVARRARVFHYRDPHARVSARDFGTMAMLNRTYVVCKHSAPGSVARRQLRRFLYYQLCRYLPQLQSAYGRARFGAAVSALADALRLMTVQREDLERRYTEAIDAFARVDPEPYARRGTVYLTEHDLDELAARPRPGVPAEPDGMSAGTDADQGVDSGEK